MPVQKWKTLETIMGKLKKKSLVQFPLYELEEIIAREVGIGKKTRQHFIGYLKEFNFIKCVTENGLIWEIQPRALTPNEAATVASAKAEAIERAKAQVPDQAPIKAKIVPKPVPKKKAAPKKKPKATKPKVKGKPATKKKS